MNEVWVVESGDYEQRGIVGVFATEQVAVDYCAASYPEEEPTRFTVWDRVPLPLTYYEVEGLHVEGVDRIAEACRWRKVKGGYRTRSSHKTDELHVEEAATVRVSWWGHVGPAVVVVAHGHDKAAVEALFAERWQAVLDGFRPDDDGRGGRSGA